MVFSPKELENLEQLNDSRDELASAESEGQVGVDKDPVDPLVWRLKVIERAALRVKKLYHAKLDKQASYQAGELVFDDKAKRFARVQSSLHSLSLSFLSGGHKEYEVLQPSSIDQKLPVVARSLPAANKAVTKLPVKVAATTATTAVAVQRKPVKKIRSRLEKAVKRPALGRGKEVTAAQQVHSALSSVKQRDDYIRTHYLKMGNKELARHTGLSEHTIRRKLGEWSLRRPTA